MRLFNFAAAASLSLVAASASHAVPTAQDIARARAHPSYQALLAKLRQCTTTKRAKNSGDAYRRCSDVHGAAGSIIGFDVSVNEAAAMIDNIYADTQAGMDALRRAAGSNVPLSLKDPSIDDDDFDTLSDYMKAFNKAGFVWSDCLRNAALAVATAQTSNAAVSQSSFATCAPSERAFAKSAATMYSFQGYSETDQHARIVELAKKMRAGFDSGLSAMRAKSAGK